MPYEPSSDEIRDTFASFGLAIFLCQSIETNLSNSLVAYGKLTGEAITMAQFDALEENLQKKTMGTLLAKVREVVALDIKAEEILGCALQKRNSLIHHYFRERAYDWYRQSSFEAMRKEISEMVDGLELASSVGEAIHEALSKACGVTAEHVHHELRKWVE